MYSLYFVYYILFPVAFIILIKEILSRRDYINNLSRYGEERTRKNKKAIDKTKADLKKLQVIFVVFILLFIPAINFSYHSLQEITIDRHRIYTGAFSSFLYSPLDEQKGPSTDVDSVLQEMEDDESYDWYVEDIKDEIDFDDLTRIPGRLTAYYLDKRSPHGDSFNQIVITYSYYSPIPITRVYGFEILPIGEGEEMASLMEERTLVYPLDPGGVDPF